MILIRIIIVVCQQFSIAVSLIGSMCRGSSERNLMKVLLWNFDSVINGILLTVLILISSENLKTATYRFLLMFAIQ